MSACEQKMNINILKLWDVCCLLYRILTFNIKLWKKFIMICMIFSNLLFPVVDFFFHFCIFISQLCGVNAVSIKWRGKQNNDASKTFWKENYSFENLSSRKGEFCSHSYQFKCIINPFNYLNRSYQVTTHSERLIMTGNFTVASGSSGNGWMSISMISFQL